MTGQIDTLEPLLVVLDLLTSAGVITLLFALMFKFLPDVEIAWRDLVRRLRHRRAVRHRKVWNRPLPSMSEVGSAYGAAGSLIVILSWIYDSGLILSSAQN